jgi:hypothetical protein
MFRFLRTLNEGKIFEQAYKNALTCITAKLLAEIHPESLAYSIAYYLLSVQPTKNELSEYMAVNHTEVENTAKSAVLSDPSFRDLVAATATVGAFITRARGQLDVSERMLDSWAFSLSAKPDHITATGFQALVAGWGQKLGFVE